MSNKDLRVYYYDSSSILVINPKGQIRKLYTPFRVLCISTIINCVEKGSWVFVDEVKSNRKDELIFVVGGRPYPYQHFQIHINF